MKRLMSLFVLVLLVGMASAVWAGAHEEIAKASRAVYPSLQ